ncbi:hypothetical protein Dimus_004139 [Dionaea muscipula]
MPPIFIHWQRMIRRFRTQERYVFLHKSAPEEETKAYSVFDEMPHRRSAKPPRAAEPTHIRRSSRLLQLKNPPQPQHPTITDNLPRSGYNRQLTHFHSPRISSTPRSSLNKLPLVPASLKSSNGFINDSFGSCRKSIKGSKTSSSDLSTWVVGVDGLRRSPRLLNRRISGELTGQSCAGNFGHGKQCLVEMGKGKGTLQCGSRSNRSVNSSSRTCRKLIEASGTSSDLSTRVMGIQGLRRSTRLLKRSSSGELIGQICTGRRPKDVGNCGDGHGKQLLLLEMDKGKGTLKWGSGSNGSIISSDSCRKLIKVSTMSSDLSARVVGIQGLRRSPRLLGRSSSGELMGQICAWRPKDFGNFGDGKQLLLEMGKGKGTIKSGSGSQGEVVCELSQRKRKRIMEGIEQRGWTKEQELALQRAYFAVKPTPHFWKKVAKQVEGKSAQECFDKVNAENPSPLLIRPPSKAKRRINMSPTSHSSYSAKLLKLTEPKEKRMHMHGRRRKSHIAQRTARHLLQKHCLVSQGDERDLFSVLEPNVKYPSSDQSTRCLTQIRVMKNNIGSSPMGSINKRVSRLSDIRGGTCLISPPVLKKVKDLALHEKYIDHLHLREAKRKALFAREVKRLSKKDKQQSSCIANSDAIKAAKHALVSDARDAISRFQHLQVNVTENSYESEEYFLDEDELTM